MTDDEILAHQRAKHGNPYLPLSMAKKMQHEEYKWRHLAALAKKRAQEGKLPAPSHAATATGRAALIGEHRECWARLDR